MKIPFTVDEFNRVFQDYNEAVWPLPVVFYALAIFAVLSVIRRSQYTNIIVFSILGFFWIWMGAVYHLVFFSKVNTAANIFGVMFVAQGLLFLHSGVYRQTINLEFTRDASGALGILIIVYALVGYPTLGLFLGHAYPAAPTFGVPCPTAIFTFGMLLFAKERIGWYMIIFPLVWSLVGLSAAVDLNMPQDYGLVAAGIVSCVAVLFLKPKHAHRHVAV